MSIHSRGARVLPALFLAVGLLMRGGFSGPSLALAYQPDQAGVFELDGNACANSATFPPTDWSALFHTNNNCVTGPGGTGTNGSPGTPLASTFIDEPIATDTTYLTGGSSKDPSDFNNWLLQTCASPPPNPTGCSVQAKDQIDQAFAALYVPTSGPATGHQIMYFGDDRFANNGDAFTGFWITKQPINFNGTNGVSCSTPICGQHSVGDLLISSNFVNGGASDEVRVYQWNPAAADGPLHLLADVTQRCGPSNTNDFCEITNTGGQAAPWTYQFKGATGGVSSTFPQATFFEGGIDLTSFAGANACFSTFIAETRSSQSFTSTLSDVAMHSFPTCSAKISIAPNGTNVVGNAHTITATVSQTAGGVSSPASGANVTFSLPSGTNSAGGTFVGGVNTCTTNASGQCSIQIISNTPGKMQVHASATVTIGTGASATTFTVQTDGQNGDSGDVTKTFVNGRISISPLSATNVSGQDHTLTAFVEKNDGDATGWQPASGRSVTFTLPNNNAGATFKNGQSTCTTGAAGTCSVTITTSSVGSTNIQACSSFDATVDSVWAAVPPAQLPLTRCTGDSFSGDGSSASKTYINGRIFITPHAPVNSVGAPETFTITVQTATSQTGGVPNWQAAPAGLSVSYNITSANTDATIVSGTPPTCPSAPFTTSGSGNTNASGQVTVTVLSCQAGTITLHASHTFTAADFPSVTPALPAAQNFTRSTSDSANTGLGDSNACSSDSTSSGANCFNDAVKTYKSGTIQIEKTVVLGPLTPAPNICFTITRTDGGTLIVSGAVVAQDGTANKLCFSAWTAASGTTGISNPHTYSWSGLASGHYRVVESTSSFPYNLNTMYDSEAQGYPGPTDIALDVVNGPATVDLTSAAPYNNPLPPGQLQVQKDLNGVIEPTTGPQFSFTATYCGSGAVGQIGSGMPGACSNTGATYTFTVPGCDWDTTNASQPTTGCTLKNPVTLLSLPEGYYKINENPKAGFATDVSVYVVAVYAGNNLTGGPGVPLTTFNNTQKFRIVAYACNMTDQLVPASVSLATGDGRGVQSGTTLSAADLTSWNSATSQTATEAQICHLEPNAADNADGSTNTGGNFLNLSPAGSYSPSIGPLPPH